MRPTHIKLILLFAFILPLDSAFSQDIHNNYQNSFQIAMVPAGEQHDIVPPPIEDSWLDNTENYIAEKIHDVSTYLDEGLGKKEEDDDLVNRSYVKFKIQSEYTHRGYFSSKEKISARIDLPHIKRNWKIILETDPDDYDSLETKQRDFPSEGSSATQGAIGGLDYPTKKFKAG
ncbi:hypothetical protein [Vibrio sp. HN007]|uniref:hypothetical protein n=1 Tax=Vibrio iocasae TaxID=3098914 RepID=UPI0035D4586D